MRIIQKTIRTFREMLEAQKEGVVSETAVDCVRNWLLEVRKKQDIDREIQFWREKLDSIGFVDAEVTYSLGSSHNDGASFTCQIDMEKMLSFMSSEVVANPETPQGYIVMRCFGEGATKIGDNDFDWLFLYHKYLTGQIWNTSCWYVHADTVQPEIDYLRYLYYRRPIPFVDVEIDRLEKAVKKLVRDLCHCITSDLYDCLKVPDEDLMRDCDTNGWHFHEDGRIEQ